LLTPEKFERIANVFRKHFALGLETTGQDGEPVGELCRAECRLGERDARKMTQIRPAINYIDAHYDQPITLAGIAKASHLSVSRLAHVFKEQMGITLIDYVTGVRIERAKELLLGTDQSGTEICFQAGYHNQSYFTRTFKSLVGMTPRQFRVQNQRKGMSPDRP
jgi:YesN/AraC family two-component response regulator